MSVFFKRLIFFLKGGIPTLAKYEAYLDVLEKKFEKYNALKASEAMVRYYELAAQIFTPRRQSGLSKRERKRMKQEFSLLRKSAEVVDFFKLQKSSRNFRSITDWELAFEDTFNGSALDTSKWITCPYAAGRELLYSSAEENHLYTDGANVSVANQSLKIVTKSEHATGLAFGREVGFVNAERNFTSGIVNTGKSYTQQYGKIEAKIRFSSPSKKFYHAMWLSTQRMLPHINVVRIGSKVELSVCAQGALQNEVQKYVDLWRRRTLKQNTPYIVTLEWNEQTITWKVNGAVLFTAPNVVKEPMYIGFSSGLTGKYNRSTPAVFEIDWVKAYRYHESAAV